MFLYPQCVCVWLCHLQTKNQSSFYFSCLLNLDFIGTLYSSFFFFVSCCKVINPAVATCYSQKIIIFRMPDGVVVLSGRSFDQYIYIKRRLSRESDERLTNKINGIIKHTQIIIKNLWLICLIKIISHSSQPSLVDLINFEKNERYEIIFSDWKF